MDKPAPREFDALVAIMARLRDPEAGCPWDVAQNFATIAPYTLEEAYEVADAIARDDMSALPDELGDLLLQVVFHSRMAEEQNTFNINDVIGQICDKMERRHPHIFGDTPADDADAVVANWEAIKAEERAAKAGARPGALSDVALALPSLLRAYKLQKRAAGVGFDWPDAEGPKAKILEELDEVATATTDQHRAEEVGDLLFSVVNYARHLGVEPEQALRTANTKFERRFRSMERMSNDSIKGQSLDELERLWQKAKSL
jgi:nucleoside triphosphate diphosphatase